jgi:hypothetical protein
MEIAFIFFTSSYAFLFAAPCDFSTQIHLMQVVTEKLESYGDEEEQVEVAKRGLSFHPFCPCLADTCPSIRSCLSVFSFICTSHSPRTPGEDLCYESSHFLLLLPQR